MSEDEPISMPGTIVFLLFLAGGSLALSYEAYAIQGLPTVSGPGMFPLIAAGTMAAIALGLLVAAILRARAAKADAGRRAKRGSVSEIISPLILGYTLFCLAYVLVLERIGFWPASAIFLPISFALLYSRNPLRIGAITVLVLAVVYVVFAYIFRVYLP